MKQAELICGECPLTECNEESLWCVFRLLTNPNMAQRALIVGQAPRLRKKKLSGKEYQSMYHRLHRTEKQEYDRTRYQDRVQARVNRNHSDDSA